MYNKCNCAIKFVNLFFFLKLPVARFMFQTVSLMFPTLPLMLPVVPLKLPVMPLVLRVVPLKLPVISLMFPLVPLILTVVPLMFLVVPLILPNVPLKLPAMPLMLPVVPLITPMFFDSISQLRMLHTLNASVVKNHSAIQQLRIHTCPQSCLIRLSVTFNTSLSSGNIKSNCEW